MRRAANKQMNIEILYKNCLHNEMKLKQNSFETVSNLFCFSFISLCGQFKYYTELATGTAAINW